MSAAITMLNSAKTPVVALHSSASDGSQWETLTAQLEAGFDVIAIDLPGYGSSVERTGYATGINTVIAPIIERIEDVGEPVHLVGHSFGGAAALKIAMERPDLVRSLVLYEPALFHLLRFGTQGDRVLHSEIRKVADALNKAIAIGEPENGLEQLIEYWSGTGAWQRFPEPLKEKLVANSAALAVDLEDILAEGWQPQRMESVMVPTLVLMGLDSPQASQRATAMVAEHVPEAEFAMLPDLGHMAPIQSPEWVVPRIHQYIARVEKSAPHVSWPQRSAA